MSIANRIGRGVKATLGADVARLAAKGGITLLLTRVFLEPDEYGLVFLAIAVFSIATVVGSLGIPKSTAKFLAEYREKDDAQVHHVVRISATALAAVVVLVSLSFYFLSDWIAGVYDEPALAPLLAIGAAYIVVKVAYVYVRISFQGFGRVPLSAATTAVSSVGQLGCVVLFLSLGFGTIGAIGGYVAGYALGVAFGAVFLGRLLREYPRSGPPESGLARRILEYSVPLTASQGGNLLYKRVDTLLVGFFLTPLAVGFYELAKQVSEFVIAPANSLGFTVAPTFGEHKSGAKLERAARVYEQSFEVILLLYLPAVAGIVLLAEPGIQFVFGPAYAGAAPVLQIFSAFVLFQALDKITNDSLDYLGRATERAIGKGITGTLNVGLNIALIPTIGVVGAAISTAVCFAIMVTYNVYLIDCELPLDRHRMAKSIAAVSVVTGGMTAVVYAAQPYVDGLFTLFGAVAVGVFVWAVLSVAGGLLDLEEVRSQI
ncbi:flippase [Natrarchaeobius halalkaliphilus]|uniref:Flippase n=1 Tax=Natrarchaeobius halalkaliphilus TaxID=1679091 RepID=A0A3N6M2X3_9EURY|nr:flippase [Natrarchaeobius halalkaliphilus]RQG90180.1 flippase [Natrarchaeobius halalkaliphilus]